MNQQKPISAKELRQHFDYNPETGTFIRKTRQGRYAEGTEAGVPNGTGRYLHLGIKGRSIRAHRAAYAIMMGRLPPPDLFIDHVNGDGQDNRWSNLRLATRQENRRNSRKPCNNRSGFKGVSWNRDTKKWMACINVAGKNRNLGYYETPELAAQAYGREATLRYGAFARLD